MKKFVCKVCGHVHEGTAAPDICPVCKAPASEFAEQPAKKGMFSDKNGNPYIIMYSTIMVVVVATLLAVAALGLQSRQNANMLNEKKQAILQSLFAAEAAAADTDASDFIAGKGLAYDSFIEASVLDAEGRATEGEDVFALLGDLKASFDAGKYPIFAAEDGRVVIPVTGSGLWGPVWGYVALEKDMNTVAGIVLDHKGETPGQGAEIATPKFQSYFVGKKIFEGDEFVSVALRKGGASAERIDHEVDAISGGTKTSDGVTAMLRNSLSHYLPYLEARRAAEAAGEVSNAEIADNNEQ